MKRRHTVLMIAISVAGCGRDEPAPAPEPRDPQVERALNDPLMTDPDLSAVNEGAAALTVEVGQGRPVLPPRPEDIAAARAEATAIIGGGRTLATVPPANGTAVRLADRTLEAHLGALPGGARCKAGLTRSTIWAARLPAALSVYPRGATASAAGFDSPRCAVRIVKFTTPVPMSEVLAFYWARAKSAGFSPKRLRDTGAEVFVGSGRSLQFDLRASEADGITSVRIATLQR